VRRVDSERNIEGAAPDATRCAPGEPSLAPIQVSEIPFPGPASPLDVGCDAKPAKNSPSSQSVRTTVVPDALGAVVRTSRRRRRPRWGIRVAFRLVDGMRSESCAISPRHSSAQARAPENALGRKPESHPEGPSSRIARRQLQLPRARALGRKRNCLGHGRPRLSCPRRPAPSRPARCVCNPSCIGRRTSYEFLMPRPSSWEVHCAC